MTVAVKVAWMVAWMVATTAAMMVVQMVGKMAVMTVASMADHKAAYWVCLQVVGWVFEMVAQKVVLKAEWLEK